MEGARSGTPCGEEPQAGTLSGRWVLLRARFGISFFFEGPVLSASVGPAPVDDLGAHFDSSFFLEGVVLTASEGTNSGCSIFPWDRFGNSFVLKGQC